MYRSLRLARWKENPTPGMPLVFDHSDNISRTEAWIFITKVELAEWWVGTVLDKNHFRSADVLRRLRRQRIGAGMASLAFLVFLAAPVVAEHHMFAAPIVECVANWQLRRQDQLAAHASRPHCQVVFLQRQ